MICEHGNIFPFMLGLQYLTVNYNLVHTGLTHILLNLYFSIRYFSYYCK